MGQIARDNLHTTNRLKDILGMIIGYPGWNIGTIRLFGGIGRGAYQFATNQRLDTQARLALQYAAGKALRAGIQGAIMNKLMTGEWPKNIYEIYTWPTGQKDSHGNWIRVTPPEYLIRDLLSYVGHERKQDPNDILGPGKALIEVAASKLSWPLVAGYEIYKNADFFGNPIYFGHAEPKLKQAYDIIKHIAEVGGVPFSIENIGEQQRQTGAEGGPVGFARELMTQPGVAIKQAAVGMIGLTPSPRSLRQTAMQNYVDMIEQNQIRSRPMNPQQMEAQNALRDLRAEMRAFRAGQGKAPDVKAYLKRGITPQEILEEWKQSKMKPLEAALHRIPLAELGAAWQIADDHGDQQDMETARKVMIQRIGKGAWQRLTPEQKQELAPMLRKMFMPSKEEKKGTGTVA
jgi:hypothetical protein